jgi:hypothetical protein
MKGPFALRERYGCGKWLWEEWNVNEAYYLVEHSGILQVVSGV